MMCAQAGGAAGAAAMTVRAIMASGAIVRVEPEDFLEIISRQPSPLVVCARGGVLQRWTGRNCQYLTSYKGLAFYAASRDPLPIPEGSEVVLAQKIWIPQ